MCTYVSLCLYMCIYIHMYIYYTHVSSLSLSLSLSGVSHVALVMKNPSANVGDVRDTGSIPGSKKIPWRRARKSTPSSILAWRIPCTEETGRLQSIGLHRVGHNWSDLAHVCVYACVCVLVFPRASMVRNLPANAGDTSSIPGLGRSPGGRNSNPFQYSCLENSMDRGTWQSIIHGVTRDWTQLSTHTRTHLYYCEINEIYLLVVKSLQFFI